MAIRLRVRQYGEAGIRPAKAALERPDVMSLTCAWHGRERAPDHPYVSPGPVLPGARSGP
ncbi:hypothetical protein GCM10010332_17920 [Streptomyces albogriseolus]|nr:hypothetical protein GCM10010332_17920 [Streptomyces albogriseolus]